MAIFNEFHQKMVAEAKIIEYLDLDIDVWYANVKTSKVEPGKVFSARAYHKGTLKDFKVRFTEGIEVFKGEALGTCIFLNREGAVASLGSGA